MPLLGMHPDPGPAWQRESAGGKLELQLRAHHAEQDLPQAGAVQRRHQVPFDSSESQRRRGLHLREAHKRLGDLGRPRCCRRCWPGSVLVCTSSLWGTRSLEVKHRSHQQPTAPRESFHISLFAEAY